MNTTTITARGAAALVALVAGAASFEHIASVAIAAGERPWVAYSLPGAIDGLVVVGVAALIEDKKAGRTGRLSARLAVLVGVLATLAANIASAEPTATARLVAMVAPVSFLLATEVLTRSGKRRADADTAATATATTAPTTAPATAITPATATDMAANVAAPVAAKPAARKAAGVADETAEKVAALLAEKPSATVEDVAAAIGRRPRTARRYLSAVRATMAANAAAPGRGRRRTGRRRPPASCSTRPCRARRDPRY